MTLGISRSICRGICHRMKATRPDNGQRYANGQRRCDGCETFFDTNIIADNKCPCCKRKLRAKPKNGRYKEAFRVYIE